MLSIASLTESSLVNHLIALPATTSTPVSSLTPQRISRQDQIQWALKQAIKQRQFSLYYQPQFNLQTQQLIGVEALIRWHHPELGMIPPGEFIPLAEREGQIVDIGYWVLTEACSQYRFWQQQGCPPFKLAVNLSLKQLMQPDIVERIAAILQKTHMPPQYLQLEVTESLIYENIDQIINTLNSLNRMGIQLAIDDFGTGYSALSVLKHLPIHSLKLDRSFLDDLNSLSKSSVILESIINLGHRLHLNVIAEGVENQDQLCMLKSLHCDVAQGYFLSYPLTVEKLTRHLTVAFGLESTAILLS